MRMIGPFLQTRGSMGQIVQKATDKGVNVRVEWLWSRHCQRCKLIQRVTSYSKQEDIMRSLVCFLVLCAGFAQAGPLVDRPGWVVIPTEKSYAELVESVPAAVKSAKMAVVTQAGPTGAAASRGITIPGNRVLGIYNSDFAVRVLELSTAAMIEAPIRMYATENEDGTATLSYKLPSHVFAPYMDEGGAALAGIAAELDAKFATIAEAASK